MSVNKAILVGRLGRDPETRYTSAGQAVCNFTLATDETYKDRNGERQKRTEWHRIVVWGKQAEIAQQYLHKGSLIFLEGRIQTRQWDDREGQKRTTVEIVATNFRMLGGRGEGGMTPGVGAVPVPARVKSNLMLRRQQRARRICLPRKFPTKISPSKNAACGQPRRRQIPNNKYWDGEAETSRTIPRERCQSKAGEKSKSYCRLGLRLRRSSAARWRKSSNLGR